MHVLRVCVCVCVCVLFHQRIHVQDTASQDSDSPRFPCRSSSVSFDRHVILTRQSLSGTWILREVGWVGQVPVGLQVPAVH